MGILASLLTGPIINVFLSTALEAFKAYNEKKLTQAELEAKIREAFIAAFAEVETAWAESYAKSYGAFISGAAQSAILAYGWLTVVLTQLAILLWYQIGVPTLVYFGHGPWPSAGATVDWSYLLLLCLFGAGALALKPKAGDWKSLTK
jgi:hypothetical protein